MKKILAIIALVLAPGLAQAQTYSGTVYPSNSNGITCTPASCTITAPIIGTSQTLTGTLTLPVSTASSNASILFGGGLTIWSTASPEMNFGTVAAGYLKLGATAATIASTGQFAWSSGAIYAAGADTGLARISAGLIRATDGAAGYGAFRATNGTAALPAYNFNNGATTGLYYDTTANDALGVSFSSQTRVLITGDRTLGDASATTIFTVPITTGQMIGLTVDYTVMASNATPSYTTITGTFHLAIINDTATETCSTIVEAGETTAASDASTLTFTATCDTSGTNSVAVQVNSDSSLTTPTIIGQFIIRASSNTAIAITIS